MLNTPLTRRSLMSGSLSGFFAYAMHNRCEAALAAPAKREKRCIVLWMNGGPSQLDTFDPKPGTATGGEFKTISTAIPGLSIAETLPNISRHLNKLSIVRNVTSSEGEHIRGQYYLHTGYPFVPAFPRPAIGAVASHEARRDAAPNYVVIGGRGYGPAYMGPDHAPFTVENIGAALALMRGIRRRRSRLQLLQDLGASFNEDHREEMLERREAMISKIQSLVTTPFVDAFDLSKEKQSVRARYGDGNFGRSCLAARRLLETGVRFVEVQHDGWDTHQNNFAAVRRLCGDIDQPWAALMEDLQTNGLLADTVVVWMGEFGRTPRINATRGRDHFPRVTPVVMGGGGIKGGVSVGKTDRQGLQIAGPAYKVPDLFATLFSALGLSLDQEFQTEFGSPTTLTDKGKLIKELV